MYTETRAGTRKTHICDKMAAFSEVHGETGKQDGGGPGEVRGSQGG